MHIIDCPGYYDTNGCYRMLGNAYFSYRAFSKIKNIKFCLTFRYTDLSGTAAKFVSTITTFIRTFKDFEKVKEHIFKATVFAFTRSPKNSSRDKLKEILVNLISPKFILTLNKTLYGYYIQLIKNIIDNNKIFLFEIAEKDIPTP